jgi:hypothetical protein
MRFYIVSEDQGVAWQEIDCFRSFLQARNRALEITKSYGTPTRVMVIDVPVTAESIRRLLGHLGGYAKSLGTVQHYHPSEVQDAGE